MSLSLSLSPAFSPTLCALPFDYSYLAGVSLTATASCNDCVMHLCLVVFLCCVETNVSSLAPSCSNNSRGKPPTAQLYHTDSFHVCYLFFLATSDTVFDTSQLRLQGPMLCPVCVTAVACAATCRCHPPLLPRQSWPPPPAGMVAHGVIYPLKLECHGSTHPFSQNESPSSHLPATTSYNTPKTIDCGAAPQP